MNPGLMILRAGWVVSVSAPPLREGAVVIDGGRIAAVGPASDLAGAYPAARLVDLPDAILIPGLVNPHTHLELSGHEAGDTPGGSFTDWIVSIAPRMRQSDESIEVVVTDATRRGIEQCLRFGVTTVGDITRHIAITRPILADSPLRSVSFGEALGLAAARPRFEAALAAAADETFARGRLRVGISPHAPYTVDLDGYRQCVELARRRRLPLATHLAETCDETAFLVDHSGPFREVWQRLGTWAEGVTTYPGRPIRFAAAVGLLDLPAVLAHVNDCDESELDLLSRGRAGVVHCPRTHRYFGRPPHPWREMLDRGINVALGTDSCASSPDLDLMAEARVLFSQAPDTPPARILEMITLRGAKMLGMQSEIGSLEAGKRADIGAWIAPGPTDDPIRALLATDAALPAAVWIDGDRVA